MNVPRRALLALPAVLATAAWTPREESTYFIQWIYEKGFAEPSDLTAGLARLFAEDWRRETKRLTFDWLHGGQGEPQMDALQVVTLNRSGTDQAAVEASFTNRGEPFARRFLLVRGRGRWEIEDVRMHPEGLDLRAVLRGQASANG